MSTVWLSLGSNQGDRAAYLRLALRRLAQREGVTPIKGSAMYETAPWGGVEQDNYLNACLQLETTLSPEELLDLCQAIEAEAGRRRELRWGPRTLDIDILLYDDLQLSTPRLTLPHPRMRERLFVLAPLLELTEEAPLLGRIDELMAAVKPQGLLARTSEEWQVES